MVKKVVTILLGLLCFQEVARADLLACLGKEELVIHRSREGGAIYSLNQFFVNRLSSGGRPILTGEYQQKICGSGRGASPSVALLKHLLLDNRPIFVGSVDAASLRKEARSAFFAFLFKIQEMAPNHQCLEKHLPHYAYFVERHKHLEMEGMTFLREKEKLSEMLRTLEKPVVLLKKCRR